MSRNNFTTNGISIPGLLGIVFVTLKLTGVIDWSWWWVTLPFWGILAFGIAAILIAAMFVLIKFVISELIRKRK